MLNLDTYRTTEALDPELARVIMDNRHNWRVHIFALCVGYDGVPYMKQDEVCVSDSVRHSELLPYLNDAHAVLCAECNVRDLVRPAWTGITHWSGTAPSI